MKLTKQQLKLHSEAEELLKRDGLSPSERAFVVDNWQPGAHHKTQFSAFYTPQVLASHLAIEADVQSQGEVHFLDLAAGIGSLSLAVWNYCQGRSDARYSFTCVEIDPGSIAVGKKVMPEANWIEADLHYLSEWERVPKADVFISNPPFGRLPPETVDSGKYEHLWEYFIASMGLSKCWYGVMIVPAASLPWRMSGQPNFTEEPNPRYERWSSRTGVQLRPNCGIDTRAIEGFLATDVKVEIACVEKAND